MSQIHSQKAVLGKKMDNLSVRLEKPLFLSLAENLIADLSVRSQEIIRKRFGLSAKKGETLENIGNEYDITRERIRQIIAEGRKNISAKSEEESFLKAEEKIIFTIRKNSGIIKESDVIEKFNSDGPEEANAIRFFVVCSKLIFEVEEKGILEKAWVADKSTVGEAKKIIATAEGVIQKEKKLLTDQEIFKKLIADFPQITVEKILSFLKVSVRIKKNKFGRWGMLGWVEVNPKVTRDRIYLILKEQKRPLHFTQIAKLIDEFKLSKKKAHPQTVHNELIKDDRFVLIGRGIYALKEWGYFAGTIREIIKVILEKSGRPMDREDIMQEVLKMRQVKKTTIAINLNNRKYFQKEGELYSIKK